MTFEQNSALPRRFVTSTLPWLVGLGAALVYLATMSRWATFGSITTVSRVSGWNWQPELAQPLAFLIYYPFRYLPEHLIPIGLNLFNALLAALTVTLVARAVTLLPHNRTSDQRELANDGYSLFLARSAWIPPVLAALVLGLQISFWENATAVSPEIIDVFITAYVVRCLLEYRIDQKQSWMTRVAFIYAAGITNNWAFIALAPALLMAIIWIKGVSFFNGRFITRMILWGIIGLSLYLLLPLISVISGSSVTFGQALTANLSGQKQMLANIHYYLRDNYRYVPIVATSLLPLFFISLRWKSSFGDTSPIGIFITKAVFHIVHAVFFVVCLLVVLSPPYSPRQLVPGLTFLNHTYFAALVVGYCSGYFLLICGPALKSRTRMNSLLRLAGYVGWGGVVVGGAVIATALVGRNWEPIKLTNGKLIDGYMEQTLAPLPEKPSAIVCDNPARLALVRAYLVHRGDADKFVFCDTQSAAYSDYHIAQRTRQGERWPDRFSSLTNGLGIRPEGLIAFMNDLVAAGPVYYLEPSFGYYFERFELKPHGMIYELLPYSTNSLFQTPLTDQEVESNQLWWARFDEQILPLLKNNLPSDDGSQRPGWLDKLYQRLHLKDEQVPFANAVGQYASRSANYWAVVLQRRGMWAEAALAFRRALTLNPDNVAAQVSLDFNEARQANLPAPESVAPTLEDEFGKYQDWNQVMSVCGPFDEPRFTFEQGRTFFAGQLYRQALQTVTRVIELEPRHYAANVWLADIYVIMGIPDRAMDVVSQLRRAPDEFELNPTRQLYLDRIEASALLREGKSDQAREVLLTALNKPEAGTNFVITASQLFLRAGMNKDAVPLLETLVQQNPSDLRSLANLGYANLQLGNFERAKEVLTRALELDPSSQPIRLNRAITLLRAKEYDAAKEDYLLLQADYPNAYQVQYGLGEIAAANNDIAAAVAYFEECLKLTPAGSPDYVEISNRLASVRSQSK